MCDVRGIEERYQFLPGRRPTADRRKELDFQAGFWSSALSSGFKSRISLRAGPAGVGVRFGAINRRSRSPMFGSLRRPLWSKAGSRVASGRICRASDLDNPGFFDNAPNHAWFWGVLRFAAVAPQNSLEAIPGLGCKEAHFQRGTAQEVRHTWGEVFPPYPTEQPGWISTTKASGSSARSVRRTLRPGPSPPKQAIPSQPSYEPRFSAKSGYFERRQPNSGIGNVQSLFPKGIILAFWPRRAQAQLTS